METKINITVQSVLAAGLEHTWNCFTSPDHIVRWNHASDDWHCPAAINDLRAGGSFNYTMAARDGSFQFGFEGLYDEVIPLQLIRFTLADGRKVSVQFSAAENTTIVTETFEAENIHSPELQEQGWQSILNNFKSYTESLLVA